MSEMKRPEKGLGNPKKLQRFNGNSCASQRTRLLKHFHDNPRLSTIQAREQYGILHPCGRIMELRKKGHQIDTHWISEVDVSGQAHRVGLYVYKGLAQGGNYAR